MSVRPDVLELQAGPAAARMPPSTACVSTRSCSPGLLPVGLDTASGMLKWSVFCFHWEHSGCEHLSAQALPAKHSLLAPLFRTTALRRASMLRRLGWPARVCQRPAPWPLQQQQLAGRRCSDHIRHRCVRKQGGRGPRCGAEAF